MIVIDIGNTNIKVGFLENLQSEPKVEIFNDLSSFPKFNTDYLVYSSVSPAKEKYVFSKIKADVVEEISPLNIKSMKFIYSPLDSLGKDRVAAALGTFELYGGNSLIIDFGTAITFDFVDKIGVFRGGSIYPGPQTVLDCLKLKTEKVKVETFEPLIKLGNNTAEAVNSAITSSVIGITEKMIDITKPDKLVITGGYFSVFKDFLPSHKMIYDKWLVLKGLYIYGKNRRG